MTMNTKVDSIKQLVGFGMLVLKACQVFNVCRRTYYRHFIMLPLVYGIRVFLNHLAQASTVEAR